MRDRDSLHDCLQANQPEAARYDGAVALESLTSVRELVWP